MKTIEELKEMNQDDLVNLVQELQNQIGEERKETAKYKRWYESELDKRRTIVDTIRNMCNLMN